MLAWESYTRPFACRLTFRRIDEVRLVLGPTRNLFDLGVAVVDPRGWQRRSLVVRLRPWDRTEEPLLALRGQEPVAVERLGDPSSEDSVPRIGTDPFEIALGFRTDSESTFVALRVARRSRSEPLYEGTFRIEGTGWPAGAVVVQTPSPAEPFLVTLEKLSVCGLIEPSFVLEEVPWPD